MFQELTPIRDSKPLGRRTDRMRQSFFDLSDVMHTEQIDVPYKDRYESNEIQAINESGRGDATIIIYISKKMHMVEVSWLGKIPNFVGWVNETPPESPMLKFFFNRGVLKAKILYTRLWRYNRSTTVFKLVEKPRSDPAIPTLAEEP